VSYRTVYAKLGIGIEDDAAGIRIPASCTSVLYWSNRVPRTGSPYPGTGVVPPKHRHIVHSGTGLTGCRTVRHSGIDKNVHLASLQSTLQAMEWDTRLVVVLFLLYDVNLVTYFVENVLMV
jgi:hypothetical protein